MEVELESASLDSTSVNNTDVEIPMWNADIPTYLYRELPTVFEVIGVLLNITTVIYFIRTKRYQSPIFTILTGLAITDTCCCLGSSINMFTYPVAKAEFFCFLEIIIIMTGMVGSEYHLVFFAGLRLYQVILPLKARASVTVSLMVKYCATIIIFSIGSGIIYAAFWRSMNTVIDGEEYIVCIFLGDAASKDLAVLVFLTILPCGAILIFHVLKSYVYFRSKGMLDTSAQQERKSPEAHVVAIVIVLFFISWIPAHAYMVIQGIRIENYAYTRDSLFLVLAHVLFANSIVNPLVYVLAMKSIRQDFINLFCSRRKTQLT